MKLNKWIMILFISMFLISILPNFGFSTDQDRKVLNELLNELEQKVKEADKRMIAHPKFIEELLSLVKQYRSKLRSVFIYDDFSDGELRYNPTWIIESGVFKVTSSRRLLSEVYVERYPSETPAQTPERESPIGGFLREILKAPSEEKKPVDKPSVVKEARIYTLAKIEPDFEVDITMVSRSSWGSMEVILIGGNPPVPLYRLVYQASPSASRPIEIYRERDGRSFLIETASQYPFLDDGMPHRLQWIRDAQGRMRLIVDGKEILTTYEIFYRTNFSGLSLVNKGGIYEWGPIGVYKAQEVKSP